MLEIVLLYICIYVCIDCCILAGRQSQLQISAMKRACGLFMWTTTFNRFRNGHVLMSQGKRGKRERESGNCAQASDAPNYGTVKRFAVRPALQRLPHAMSLPACLSLISQSSPLSSSSSSSLRCWL